MSEENLIKAMEYGAYIKKALRIAVNVGCGFEGDAEDAASLLGLIEANESRIAELEAERRWIPVSERLPLGETVLALWKDKTIHLDWTFMDGGSCYWWNSGQANVTHWMPLPTPPEVQE